MDIRFRTIYIFRIYSSIFLLSLSESHDFTLSVCSSARPSSDLICNLPFHELWSLSELCESFLHQREIEQSREYWLITGLLALPENSQARCLLDHAITEMLNGRFEPPDPCSSEHYSRALHNFPEECWSGPHIYITDPPTDYTGLDPHGSHLGIQPDEPPSYSEFVADEIKLSGPFRAHQVTIEPA